MVCVKSGCCCLWLYLCLGPHFTSWPLLDTYCQRGSFLDNMCVTLLQQNSYLVYLYWTKEVDHHRIKWLQAYHPDVFGNEKLWKTGGEPLVEHLQFAYQGTRSVEDKSCITLKNRGHIPRSCLWTRAHSTHRPSAPASPRGVLSPHCSSPSTLMIASQKTVVENWCIK